MNIGLNFINNNGWIIQYSPICQLRSQMRQSRNILQKVKAYLANIFSSPLDSQSVFNVESPRMLFDNF
jgi:hypothetical protein